LLALCNGPRETGSTCRLRQIDDVEGLTLFEFLGLGTDRQNGGAAQSIADDHGIQ
jgi:hypothetical protein